MNSFSGHITDIRSSDALSVITVNVNAVLFKAIVIDSPETATWLVSDHPVQVQFKETEVVLATGENPAVSLQNRVKGRISAIEKGKLLSRIVVRAAIGDIVSIISTDATEQLALQEGTEVTAMIKLNEVILAS
ncbi:TOBE domain-containing protein [Sinomicrobium sp. M5D2P17]